MESRHEFKGSIFLSISIDDLYSPATVPEGAPSTGDIPDAEYAAFVEEVTLTPSSTSAPTIAWTYRIRGGNQSCGSLRKVRPITERTIAWVKEDLIKCGLELNVLSDLSEPD